MKINIVANIIISLLLMLSMPSVSDAANSLSAGVSLGADYDSNVNRTPDNEDGEWETSINAHVSLSANAPKWSLSFNYSPTFKYNQGTEDTALNHSLNFNAFRDLSERFRFTVVDSFAKTNDIQGDYFSPAVPVIEEGADQPLDVPTLSDRIGREKFWTNYFSTSLAYEYIKNSFVTLGYNNRILEYDESGMDNYKYNEPSINLSYWFNPQWDVSFSYSYTDAKFDVTEDSISHDAGVNLNHTLSVQDSVFGGLNFSTKDYDAPSTDIPTSQNDYYSIRANLGWTHAFSPQKILSLSAGPAYVDKENDDNNTTAFFDASYTNSFENGSWFVRAEGGYDDRSFDAVNQGLSESQRISGGISWLPAKNLSASLEAYFRTDSFLEGPLASDEKEFNTAAGLKYSFARWYYISGRYIYTRVDADNNLADYDDHRFFINLGFSKELSRW